MGLPTTMGDGGMPIRGGNPLTTTTASIGLAVALGGGDMAPGGTTAASAIMAATDGCIQGGYPRGPNQLGWLGPLFFESGFYA